MLMSETSGVGVHGKDRYFVVLVHSNIHVVGHNSLLKIVSEARSFRTCWVHHSEWIALMS